MASQATHQRNSATDSPTKKLPGTSLIQANRSGVASVLPPAEDCLYTQYYCEENVWQLCDSVRRHRPGELSRCHVVFISNDARCVPLWRQRAGKTDDRLVTWDYSNIFTCVAPHEKDYHVIFMYQPDERCLVFDLDSDLPFPTYFHKYVTETLRTDHILHPEHHRWFRVLPALVYLQKFASDRRHMRHADGSWLQPPPPHPAIRAQDAVHNLDEFISMDTSKPGIGGTVYNLTDFVRCFFKAK
ncbi:protein N-terminal glutamine amidohydrolase isoform X1 [Hyalella azteca]|uniref:Protein N-terminal glutamine amidohydrolase n=1 Tax=Hyalella azteca TaxID=294128 RepID=A0A8B7NZR5_HYAAZ|nr:protein N-terminal glutamine amidohydrolase isoform X1 [Hyalella azteca]